MTVKDRFDREILSLLSCVDIFCSLLEGLAFFEFGRVRKKARVARHGSFFRGCQYFVVAFLIFEFAWPS